MYIVWTDDVAIFPHTGSSGGSGFCAPSDRHSSDSTRHDSSKMVRFDFDSYHEFPRDVRDRTPRATRRGSPLSLSFRSRTGRAVRRSIISTDLREFRRRPPWPSAPDPVRLWAVARMAKFVDMPLSVALADVGSLTLSKLSACRDGFARREGDTARRSTLRGGSARHVGRPVRASEVGVAALYAGPHDAGPLERPVSQGGGPSASTRPRCKTRDANPRRLRLRGRGRATAARSATPRRGRGSREARTGPLRTRRFRPGARARAPRRAPGA